MMIDDPNHWNHAMCTLCWKIKRPGRKPVRMVNPWEEVCCYCHMPTCSGIYVREDPKAVHPEREEASDAPDTA